MNTIVLRLVDPMMEGHWMQWPDHDGPTLLRPEPGTWVVVPFVPTGNLEWDGERCAEVWVPADQLDHWRAEFDPC